MEKIRAIIVKRELQSAITNLRDKARNPEIGNAIIEIPNIDAEAGTIYEYKRNLNKIATEINQLAKKTNDSDTSFKKEWFDIKDRLFEYRDDFIRKHDASLDMKAHTSISHAVDILSHRFSTNVLHLTVINMKKDNIKNIMNIKDISDGDIKLIQKCINMNVELSKMEGNLLVNSLSGLIKAIYKGIDDIHDNDD